MRFVVLLLMSFFNLSLALPWMLFLERTRTREEEMVEMRVLRKREEKREREPIFPMDLLFGDELQLGFTPPTSTYLSDDVEHMDAATLLHHIEKLKEEYAGKVARGEDAEKVRSSLDRLTATLNPLTQGTSERKDSADVLAMLSEEDEDTGGSIYGGDYYGDWYGGEDDLSEDPDPSLLELQAWTRNFSSNHLLQHT